MIFEEEYGPSSEKNFNIHSFIKSINELEENEILYKEAFKSACRYLSMNLTIKKSPMTSEEWEKIFINQAKKAVI